jgi:hypothetical protein
MKHLGLFENFFRKEKEDIKKIVFSPEEEIELEKLGFKKVESEDEDKDKFVCKTNISTLTVVKDSLIYKKTTEVWYSLNIKYDEMFNKMLQNPQHFQNFDMSLISSKRKSFDTFDELLDNIKIYIK